MPRWMARLTFGNDASQACMQHGDPGTFACVDWSSNVEVHLNFEFLEVRAGICEHVLCGHHIHARLGL